MRYSNALILSILKKIAGLIITFLSTLLLTLSLLKTYNSHLTAHPAKTDFNLLIQQLTTIIGKSEGMPKWLWLKSPVLDISNIIAWKNIDFLGIYLLIFVGMALYKSGKELSLQAKEADKQAKVEQLKKTLNGEKVTGNRDIKNTARVKGSSTFQQIHQLYLAPVLTAIIITIILKLLGL